MLVGICRPKVMVSDMAAAVLSDNELRVAVRHELGHRHSWDNLKKLLINATPFPGMSRIERDLACRRLNSRQMIRLLKLGSTRWILHPP